MSTVTLLVDIDIPVYKAAIANEEETAFGTSLEFTDACKEVDDVLSGFAELLKADRMILCQSDKRNFRYDVLPTYKHNRKDVKRPEMLKDLHAYMESEYECLRLDNCEGDDVMGIYSTHDHAIDGKKIIVSEDKDMRTVPGYLYAPHRDYGVQLISTMDANRFHMWQTICGDTTDGYSGVKGVGKSSPWALDAIEDGDTGEELWDNVLCAFASKGLTETDAIQQARVARILRAEDYDFMTGEIELWTPELLTMTY